VLWLGNSGPVRQRATGRASLRAGQGRSGHLLCGASHKWPPPTCSRGAACQRDPQSRHRCSRSRCRCRWPCWWQRRGPPGAARERRAGGAAQPAAPAGSDGGAAAAAANSSSSSASRLLQLSKHSAGAQVSSGAHLHSASSKGAPGSDQSRSGGGDGGNHGSRCVTRVSAKCKWSIGALPSAH
jgi:hypothetical protein